MGTSNPGKTNLISWWRMEENGGTAYDSHGTNHLTETSGTIPAAAGKVGNARDFENDDSEYLEIASNASIAFNNTDFTVGAWIKLESLASLASVLGKGYTSTNQRGYQLWFYGAAGEDVLPKFSISRDGANLFDATGDTVLSLDTWYFLVGWNDSVAKKVYLQINNGTPFVGSHNGYVFQNTEPLRIGHLKGQPRYFDGLIDEAFIFNKVLSADERTWLYNNGAGRGYSDLSYEGVTAVFLSDYGVM